jgi:hypothetical protein
MSVKRSKLALRAKRLLLLLGCAVSAILPASQWFDPIFENPDLVGVIADTHLSRRDLTPVVLDKLA